VPGVGAQGGDLDVVVKCGRNKDMGLLINSSRGIIYAGDDFDFDTKARKKALELKEQMERYF
jgi:orotidine-5'-phosphate decarboxylase